MTALATFVVPAQLPHALVNDLTASDPPNPSSRDIWVRDNGSRRQQRFDHFVSLEKC
jgi:hypothetical protein